MMQSTQAIIKQSPKQKLKLTIAPLTAFASHLKGDTLFGQLCWAIRHLFGEQKLTECLQNYTEGEPFLVVSDAFPSGYLPRPQMPTSLLGFNSQNSTNRKQAKSKQWLPVEDINQPLNQWYNYLVTRQQTGLHYEVSEQYHNTINRATSTTGDGQFAPYSISKTYYRSGSLLDIYLVYDNKLLSESELKMIVNYCANSGFGKDASTGAGKFHCINWQNINVVQTSQYWLTLAPCCPAFKQLNDQLCFYSIFTRFGKHGADAVLQGKPFKNPIVMADTAALLTFHQPQQINFLGYGLGGNGQLSKQLYATVQQAYSPVIAINSFDKEHENE